MEDRILNYQELSKYKNANQMLQCIPDPITKCVPILDYSEKYIET